MTLYFDLSKVDWRLLRKQKLELLRQLDHLHAKGLYRSEKTLEGLLHLLDAMQDQAAESLGEVAVFGKEHLE